MPPKTGQSSKREATILDRIAWLVDRQRALETQMTLSSNMYYQQREELEKIKAEIQALSRYRKGEPE